MLTIQSLLATPWRIAFGVTNKHHAFRSCVFGILHENRSVITQPVIIIKIALVLISRVDSPPRNPEADYRTDGKDHKNMLARIGRPPTA